MPKNNPLENKQNNMKIIFIKKMISEAVVATRNTSVSELHNLHKNYQKKKKKIRAR
ncbi:hypothetical protein HanRHA438_Chr10g0469711 [Helianthus annuus]|nr:hypothetical protein HanRHA438_Chr10g0469711 [Helianthus annuus]